MKTYKSSDTESEDQSVAESDVEDLADAEQQVEWRDAGLVDEEEKKSRDGRGPRCRWWICTYNNPRIKTDLFLNRSTHQKERATLRDNTKSGRTGHPTINS